MIENPRGKQRETPESPLAPKSLITAIAGLLIGIALGLAILPGGGF